MITFLIQMRPPDNRRIEDFRSHFDKPIVHHEVD